MRLSVMELVFEMDDPDEEVNYHVRILSQSDYVVREGDGVEARKITGCRAPILSHPSELPDEVQVRFRELFRAAGFTEDEMNLNVMDDV